MYIKLFALAILIIIAAVACEYAHIRAKQKKAGQYWQQLCVQLDRYFDALAPLARYLKQTGFNRLAVMSEFKKARAALKHKDADSPTKRSLAYTHMQKGITLLAGAVKSQNMLANNDAFGPLWDSLIKYDEKIRFESAFYNNAAQEYNSLVCNLPASIVASVFSFQPVRPFEIMDESDEND